MLALHGAALALYMRSLARHLPLLYCSAGRIVQCSAGTGTSLRAQNRVAMTTRCGVVQAAASGCTRSTVQLSTQCAVQAARQAGVRRKADGPAAFAHTATAAIILLQQSQYAAPCKQYDKVVECSTAQLRTIATPCRRHDKFACVAEQAIQMQALDLNDNAANVVALRPRSSAASAAGVAEPEGGGMGSSEGGGGGGLPDVVVGNIHVLFNQKRGDTKLGQVRLDTWQPSCFSFLHCMYNSEEQRRETGASALLVLAAMVCMCALHVLDHERSKAKLQQALCLCCVPFMWACMGGCSVCGF